MAELTWMFEQIGAWGGSTGQAWKNILVSTEDLTEEGRLVREASQNANDAHDKKCEGWLMSHKSRWVAAS